MRYLLMIHTSEAEDQKIGEAEMGEILQGYGGFTGALETAGAYVAGERLRPVGDATTVRVRGGDISTTDGPFAETKEQLGGFYMIDVPDLDAAIEWAAKIPCAKRGSIEVRPIWEPEDM